MKKTCDEAARERLEARKVARGDREKSLKRLTAGESQDWRAIDQPGRLYERARMLGFTDEASAFLEDPETHGARVLEKIIAMNDLLDVLFLERGARAAKCVGRLSKPTGGGLKVGTGFLVSPRVMMTNHHVISSPEEALETRWELDFYLREDGFSTGPTQAFRLQPDALFLADAALDFALVAVEPVNDQGTSLADRGFHRLIAQSGKAVVGERVNIIQHPGGDPQKIGVHDNRLMDVVDDFVHYRTDTEGGSSGSPVFNNQWQLVALHHAAVGSANEGIRISRIVSHLRQESGGQESSLGLLADVLSPPESTGSAAADLGSASAPTIKDGKAHWVIPLHVSASLGDLSSPAPTPDVQDPAPSPSPSPSPSPAPSDPAPTDPPPVDPNDPILGPAIDALNDADALEYFNPDADGADRDAYYPSDLPSLDGTELYNRLSGLLKRTHTTHLSYSTARHQHLYPWVDRRPGAGRKLMGVYSGKIFEAEELIRRDIEALRLHEAKIREALVLNPGATDPDDLEALLESSPPFNCEHVVPQSWFQKRLPAKADMHHLFASETPCNGFRGNHAFFEFGPEAVRQNCGRQEQGKFEPMNSKAAVARATLYFLVRYPRDIADSSREMPKSRLSVLLDWHRSAEPDLWEKHRNAEIFKVQGNRNPFIDFPDLADKVAFHLGWG